MPISTGGFIFFRRRLPRCTRLPGSYRRVHRCGSPEEVVFTAGATASLNTVAYAWCERFLRAGDNIVVSEMEHHSNIVPWQLVAERKGAEIRVLPFDEEGA